jgi:hypothetical protein
MPDNPGRPTDPVDEYFERLDAAFSKLNSAASQPAPVPAVETPVAPESNLIAQAFGALLALEEGEPGARPVRLAFVEPPSPAAETAPPVAEPTITDALVDELVRRVVERLPPPVAPVALPAAEPVITDTVLADLVARVVERLPAPPAAPPPAEPVITDAMVTDLARRVIERMAPSVVRPVVADVVSEIAERLVREEIERIRGKQHV